MIRRPPRSTLFPSPPLSRSAGQGQLEPTAERGAVDRRDRRLRVLLEPVEDVGEGAHEPGEPRGPLEPREFLDVGAGTERRSEEHTSELQSQSNLVCRLLLEK